MNCINFFLQVMYNMTTKRTTNDTGLRKRPQMEQIVNYLNNGQEHAKFPDRKAKLIRNHPFMTQLDFFDMQEDQERAWEEQKREHEAERISKETDQTAAETRATQHAPGPSSHHTAGSSSQQAAGPFSQHGGGAPSRTQHFFIGSSPDVHMSDDVDETEDRFKREQGDLENDRSRKRANIKLEASRVLEENAGASPFIHRTAAFKREQRERSPRRFKSEPTKEEPVALKQERPKRSRSPKVKQEAKTNAPVIKQEPTSAPAEQKRIAGTGSAASTAAPKLQQSRGRWWAGREDPPSLPAPPQQKKRPASSDDVEITGTGGINHSTDMKFWRDSSAREIRTQFALRGGGKHDYAFKTKDQLLYIIQARIQDGNW